MYHFSSPTPPFACPSLHIVQTPHTGRSVITDAPIAAGTHLLTSADLAPFTLHRQYRREVCSLCFAYNRGVSWKVKDTETHTGAVWCSEACEAAWRKIYADSEVLAALAAVESLLSKAKGYRGDVDVMMADVSAEPPDEAEIERVWREAETVGSLILGARGPGLSTRAQKRGMQSGLAELPAPVWLTYSLQAVLVAKMQPDLWASVLELEAAPRPYVYPAYLTQHAATYLQLLCILPHSLLELCTPAVLRAAADRDMRNSFGLRSLDDRGSEMFGYGVWPSASYWNHSCDPNVKKRREGRSWYFQAARDVDAGEELCITYLGGDEKSCDIGERRQKLRETWVFECTCVKCTREAGE